MKIPADVKLTEEILCEAMELLEDMRSRMGMFEHQHYAGLKRRFEQLGCINEGLRLALNDIEIEQKIMEK